MWLVTKILNKIFVEFFHVLAQFPFTTSEMGLDHCHQKVNLRVASRVDERLKDLGSRLGNFKKIPEMLGMMASLGAVK